MRFKANIKTGIWIDTNEYVSRARVSDEKLHSLAKKHLKFNKLNEMGNYDAHGLQNQMRVFK